MSVSASNFSRGPKSAPRWVKPSVTGKKSLGLSLPVFDKYRLSRTASTVGRECVLTSLLEISIDPKADSEQIDWLARIAGRQR